MSTAKQGSCQICYDDSIEIKRLPCCYERSGDVGENTYCAKCVYASSKAYMSSFPIQEMRDYVKEKYGYLIKCPIDKQILKIEISEFESADYANINLSWEQITLSRPKGTCHNQGRFGLIDIYDISSRTGAGQCHGCFVASKYQPALTYKCKKCQGQQMISYPMFLSADSPDGYSNDSWACHVGYYNGSICEYENWKLTKESVLRIDSFDWRKNWPERGNFLKEILDKSKYGNDKEVHTVQTSNLDTENSQRNNCVIS